MDKSFLMLNFCTIYESKGNTTKEMCEEACFGTVFHSERNGIEQNNTYTIKIHKFGDFVREKRQNNGCLINRADIVRHLRVLKSIVRFKYSLKEHKDLFVLTVNINGDLMYHKYALTWIRYIYEYPFNVFLLDAHRLKKLPEFRFDSIINLFNLVGATSSIQDWGTAIHAIGRTYNFKLFMTTKGIKEQLIILSKGNNQVNNIFKELDKDCKAYTLKATSGDLHSLDYWDSEDKFKQRYKIYIKNYKILTKHK